MRIAQTALRKVTRRRNRTEGPLPASADLGDRIQADDLSVHFAGVKALEGVNFVFYYGEILGLIGPNGAGKTTLVNAVTGFQRPTRGRVYLGGRNLDRVRPNQAARLGIARTFQGAQVFAGLTVSENIEVGAVGVGAGRRAARKRAAELLEYLNLHDRSEERCDSLPPGIERQVGILRALVMRPRFLLLDEPAAGLNENESVGLRNAIAEMRQDFGCGILVIEHNTQFVLELAHRVHVLDHGYTLAVGDPDTVRNDPAVIEAYLGRRAGVNGAPTG